MELYPNPASTSIHVNAEFANEDDGEAWVEIRDVLGALIYAGKEGVVDGKMEMNVLFDERYSSGIYFFRARMNDEWLVKRFVITFKGD